MKTMKLIDKEFFNGDTGIKSFLSSDVKEAIIIENELLKLLKQKNTYN